MSSTQGVTYNVIHISVDTFVPFSHNVKSVDWCVMSTNNGPYNVDIP